MSTYPPFPTFVPTGRDIALGDWPIKKYKAINGSEIRILYGNKETEATLALSYENITDSQASEFIDHYRDLQGTFQQFPIAQEVYSGWSGSTTAGPDQAFRPEAARWRYDAPPKITNVRPGVSTVQISLRAVI